MITDEWMSITQAAERLSALGDPVDRSTLSRYLKRHGGEIGVRIDRRITFVEINGLKDHRDRNRRLRPPLSQAERAAMNSEHLSAHDPSDGLTARR